MYTVSENDNIWDTSIQFDAAGNRVFALANWTQAEVDRLSAMHGVPSRLGLTREHEGIILELNRNFRNNWTLRANLYMGEASGTEDFEDAIEAIGGLGSDGSSDVNSRNRGNRPIGNNSGVPGDLQCPRCQALADRRTHADHGRPLPHSDGPTLGASTERLRNPPAVGPKGKGHGVSRSPSFPTARHRDGTQSQCQLDLPADQWQV